MSEVRLNSYHVMWLFVMFDLPTVAQKEKRAYGLFKKNLEKDGFTMYQFSVYVRYCGSLESAKVHKKRVKSFAPAKGFVSILQVTDRQYSDIINIWGEINEKIMKRPLQLEFF